jgi:hypothetical protein
MAHPVRLPLVERGVHQPRPLTQESRRSSIGELTSQRCSSSISYPSPSRRSQAARILTQAAGPVPGVQVTIACALRSDRPKHRTASLRASVVYDRRAQMERGVHLNASGMPFVNADQNAVRMNVFRDKSLGVANTLLKCWRSPIEMAQTSDNEDRESSKRARDHNLSTRVCIAGRSYLRFVAGGEWQEASPAV